MRKQANVQKIYYLTNSLLHYLLSVLTEMDIVYSETVLTDTRNRQNKDLNDKW